MNLTFFSLNETGRKSCDNKIKMQNYGTYEFHRESSGGGVMMGIHNRYNVSELDIHNKCEHVICKIHSKNKDFIIGSVYLPNSPNTNNSDIIEFVFIREIM